MRTLAFVLLLLAAPAFGCPVESFSSDQQRVITKAMNVAQLSSYDYDQEFIDRFSVTFAGLLYQESSLCQNLRNDDDPSFGCGGVTPETANDVAGTKVSLFMLTHNETLNMSIAEQRLEWCEREEEALGAIDLDVALYCYNHGPRGLAWVSHDQAERDPYVRAVKCRTARISAFIQSH